MDGEAEEKSHVKSKEFKELPSNLADSDESDDDDESNNDSASDADSSSEGQDKVGMRLMFRRLKKRMI